MSHSFIVLFGEGEHDVALEEPFVLPGQWRVGLDGDFVLAAVVDGGALPEQRVDLELVDSGDDGRVLPQVHEVVLQKVTHSNVPDLPLLL